MQHEDIDTLAQRLFHAIETGDAATVTECYHADVAVWHNYDGITQSRDQNLKVLRWLNREIKEFRYCDIVRTCFAGGFVQRHVLRGKVGDVAIEAPTCIVAEVRDGKVSKLHEYLDSAHVAPLMKR